MCPTTRLLLNIDIYVHVPVVAVDVQYNQAVTKYRYSRSINQTFIHVMVTKLHVIVTGRQSCLL